MRPGWPEAHQSISALEPAFLLSQLGGWSVALASLIGIFVSAATKGTVSLDGALITGLSTAVASGGAWVYKMNKRDKAERAALWARIAQLETVIVERGGVVPPPIHNPAEIKE